MNKNSILITGAASGIGAATVELFANKGWLVVAADINTHQLHKLADQFGNSVIPVTADVRTRLGAEALLSQTVIETGGKLNCLFNCAGLLEMGPHPSIPRDCIDRMLDVNIHGVVYCIDAALPALKNTPGAHIINMSSTSSEYGSPDHAVYSGSKFFVKGLTEALNIEFESLNIQVSAVVVPYVNTPMVNDARFKASAIKKLGVKIQPSDVANTIWKAAHGNKVIWRIGIDALILNWLVRLLGSCFRPIVKLITGY